MIFVAEGRNNHTHSRRVRIAGNLEFRESGLNSRMCDGLCARGEFLKMTVELLRGSTKVLIKATEVNKSDAPPSKITWVTTELE